jgi:hypothetical protein
LLIARGGYDFAGYSYTIKKSQFVGMEPSMANNTVNIHVLSDALHAKRIGLPITPKLSASHLCGNTRCYQIGHVIFETTV